MFIFNFQSLLFLSLWEGWHEDVDRKTSQTSLGLDQTKFGSKNALNRRVNAIEVWFMRRSMSHAMDAVQVWCTECGLCAQEESHTDRESCSVCGQGSWCNWCNDCLSFLLCCHSLMTRPSSGGSLWQNTGTGSAGRRLSDSAAAVDAFLTPYKTFHLSSFRPPSLVCLFDICLYPRFTSAPIIGVGLLL